MRGGFNLTETDVFLYDAAGDGEPKTPAQVSVDEIRRLGGTHVELNIKAKMITGTSSIIYPDTRPDYRTWEFERYSRLIRYIKNMGMTVGLRPIFFVVGPEGEFPYVVTQPDGSSKMWWHGNIEPDDVDQWFQSFQDYVSSYFELANANNVDFFTIGAELSSMMVGIPYRSDRFQYGFPAKWINVVKHAKRNLRTSKVMYDINYTDELFVSDGVERSGGEFERWRYLITSKALRNSPVSKRTQESLRALWRELDFVGIDMYRSLATYDAEIPADYNDLVTLLKQMSNFYASEMNKAFTQIKTATGVDKVAFMKETGYRSVEKGFIDPFRYANEFETLNLDHQAAAFEAFLSSFWDPKYKWLGGAFLWDISVDPNRTGRFDKGFSPIGKTKTEEIISQRFFGDRRR